MCEIILLSVTFRPYNGKYFVKLILQNIVNFLKSKPKGILEIRSNGNCLDIYFHLDTKNHITNFRIHVGGGKMDQIGRLVIFGNISTLLS